MVRIFVALIISYVLVIGAAFVFGVAVHDDKSFVAHFALGLFATLFTCLIYSVVIVYFVITGKLIKQAVLKGGLGEDHTHLSQHRKGLVTALTAVGVLTSLAAALCGAWATPATESAPQRATLHMLAEIAALCCNLVAFGLIYVRIHTNARHVDEVFDLLNRRGHKPSSQVGLP